MKTLYHLLSILPPLQVPTLDGINPVFRKPILQRRALSSFSRITDHPTFPCKRLVVRIIRSFSSPRIVRKSSVLRETACRHPRRKITTLSPNHLHTLFSSDAPRISSRILAHCAEECATPSGPYSLIARTIEAINVRRSSDCCFQLSEKNIPSRTAFYA